MKWGCPWRCKAAALNAHEQHFPVTQGFRECHLLSKELREVKAAYKMQSLKEDVSRFNQIRHKMAVVMHKEPMHGVNTNLGVHRLQLLVRDIIHAHIRNKNTRPLRNTTRDSTLVTHYRTPLTPTHPHAHACFSPGKTRGAGVSPPTTGGGVGGVQIFGSSQGRF